MTVKESWGKPFATVTCHETPRQVVLVQALQIQKRRHIPIKIDSIVPGITDRLGIIQRRLKGPLKY